MSTSDVKVSEEDPNRSADVSTYYILDETGDTSLALLPKNVDGPEEEVDENGAKSDAEEMKTASKKFSPKSTPMVRKKRGKKRKRKSLLMPALLNNGKKPTSGPAARNNNKKRKKSVILIDSDSESAPDISIVEINDESVIVLSDDEMGVCSGSLSPANRPSKLNSSNSKTHVKTTSTIQSDTKPSRKVEVIDCTGDYIQSKSKEEPRTNDESKNSKNTELYQPLADQTEKKTGLRPVVIDGCNVAFGHGRDRFSSLGLKICVDYFKKMGHEVRAFIPQFRKHHSATTEPQLLEAMEKDGTLCLTPSRRADGKMIVSYDDRFIVQYADANGGVIVSRDNYRDLLNENPEWKETVNKRLLMYTWVGDSIMFPKDPLGRGGPNLQEFLRF